MFTYYKNYVAVDIIMIAVANRYDGNAYTKYHTEICSFS